ncbi:uncharacterized protein [Mytilus edulis]|uniref:uncharacterized protein n=1 Tax=Mytilus edulis TaxID=6550 RepID=UPI0039EFF80F
MDAAEQNQENKSDRPSVHIDKHDDSCNTSSNEAILSLNQPTSLPPDTVNETEETGPNELPSDFISEGKLHTNQCIQRPDNDCICDFAASNTDVKSNSSNLVSIEELVAQTGDETQRSLQQRNSNISLLSDVGSACVGYLHQGTNSDRNEFTQNSKINRESGSNNLSEKKNNKKSDPKTTHFSERIIPNSQDATTFKEDSFDTFAKVVFLNPSISPLLAEEKRITQSTDKPHSANNTMLQYNDYMYSLNAPRTGNSKYISSSSTSHTFKQFPGGTYTAAETSCTPKVTSCTRFVHNEIENDSDTEGSTNKARSGIQPQPSTPSSKNFLPGILDEISAEDIFTSTSEIDQASFLVLECKNQTVVTENNIHTDVSNKDVMQNTSLQKNVYSHLNNSSFSNYQIHNEVTGNVQRQISSDTPNKYIAHPIENDGNYKMILRNRSFSFEKNLNIPKKVFTDTLSFDNRPLRDDFSAYYNALDRHSSEDNDDLDSIDTEYFDEEGPEDHFTVVRIHNSYSFGNDNANIVNGALKGNIHPTNELCTSNLDDMKKLQMSKGKLETKIRKESKRTFVPDYLKNMCVPRQGNLNLNGQTRNTCTVDLLTVIFIQLTLLSGLITYFIASQAPVFNTVLPELFTLFQQQNFDDIREAWARHLPERNMNLDFFGRDRDIICPPFRKIGCFILHTERLSRDKIEVLNFHPCITLSARLENGLNCSLLENMVNSAFLESSDSGRCYVDTQEPDLLEPPPMIIVDIRDAQVKNRDVDLRGTINIGPYCYIVGGFSSLYEQHYTETIFLVDGHFFTYDNECNGLSEVEHVLGELSLIFLFRLQ